MHWKSKRKVVVGRALRSMRDLDTMALYCGRNRSKRVWSLPRVAARDVESFKFWTLNRIGQ